MKFTKIFNQAKDKNVANVVLYAKSGSNYIYSDSTMTDAYKVDANTVKDAFEKGMILNYYESSAWTSYKPAYTKTLTASNKTYQQLTCIKYGSSALTTLTLYSSEYTA